MARGNKNAKLTPEMKQAQFKKGQSGNPLGGQKHNKAIRALRKLTLATYREVIELVLTGNLHELKAMAEDPETPAVQVGIATAFMKAIKTGDFYVIEQIAARIVGKIPDVVNFNSNTAIDFKISLAEKEKLKKVMAEIEDDV